MKLMIKRVMSRCLVVFAREPEGAHALRSLGVRNVRQVPDLVLLSREAPDSRAIYKGRSRVDRKLLDVPQMAVAVIPNLRVMERGAGSDALRAYSEVITWLIGQGRPVYLLPHAREDIEVCQNLAALVDSDAVVAVSRTMPPLEFESNISQFDYAVASRFHAVVHGYRQGVPSVVFGWAVKYEYLARLVKQQRYVLDVGELHLHGLLDLVKQMDAHFQEESRTISNAMQVLFQQDPFDIAFEMLRNGRRS